jgi:hypothetical protein
MDAQFLFPCIAMCVYIIFSNREPWCYIATKNELKSNLELPLFIR